MGRPKKEKLYCEHCKKDVIFTPKLGGDICNKCRRILRVKWIQPTIYVDFKNEI